tara:strand:+ start:1100 stop:1507 length:408 start_codon:yes stop_codon:yes gene_type:complete
MAEAQKEMSKNIISTSLVKEAFEDKVKSLSKNMLIIKFGAEWCAPCNMIKKQWLENVEAIKNSGKDIEFVDIDVDDEMELYGFLKTKKMLVGIPTILAYYENKKDNTHWWIPEKSFSGRDKSELQIFFDECAKQL